MNAVKVDEAHRIQLAALKPGDYYEPEIRDPEANEITLRRLRSPGNKMTKEEVIRRIHASKLVFSDWTILREQTREP